MSFSVTWDHIEKKVSPPPAQMRQLRISKVKNGRGYATSPTPLTNQRDPCPFPREREDEVCSCRAGGRVLLHQERGYRGLLRLQDNGAHSACS
ncbi:hypothetical protein MHYP_G00067690 [Metynnis hypsauchen]